MRDELAGLLRSLEAEMRAQGRWEHQPPSDAALQSSEPFAVDTLAFDQWLQWIFVPKLHDLLIRQLPLPGNCTVHPMAEEVYAPVDEASARMIAIIAEIDGLLSAPQAGMN